MDVCPDLLIAQELVYKPSGLVCSKVVLNKESCEYAACEFMLNDWQIKFRAAKTTPTKKGQFVTFWKRSSSGLIVSYDITDSFDFLIISVRSGNCLGQFVFSKLELVKLGVISNGGKDGKRAMRVYASWDKVESKQAQKTQNWQMNYFFEINKNTETLSDFQKLIKKIS